MKKTFFILLTIVGLNSASPDFSVLQSKYQYLLENTIWIVPPSTLLAYEYFSNGTFTPVTDQTVWIIDSYDSGYFFGTAYTYISGTYSERTMIGTITNTGVVYITFYGTGSASTDLVTGLGNFTNEQGVNQFTMQMNSGSSTAGLSHWSYMISITESSPYYYDLPGVNMSLPDFLANF